MKKKILLVEDDPAILEPLAELFKDEGFEVSTAVDGLQAIALLENGVEERIVVTDLWMPRVDGYALIRWLRSRQRLQGNHPVVVFTSEWRLKPEMDDHVASGVVKKVVEKPQVDDLLAVVKEIWLSREAGPGSILASRSVGASAYLIPTFGAWDEACAEGVGIGVSFVEARGVGISCR